MKRENDNKIACVWEQLRNNERSALSELFKLTADRLFRYATKFHSDEEEVKDCIQELFVKLHDNARQLPLLDYPLFYLFRALKNILFNELKRKEKFVSIHDLPFHVEFYYETSDKNHTIDDEMKEKFERLLRCLSDRQKEAIYLRYQAGMSYEEISQLLGINYQSVRNLIFRATEKIRSQTASGLFSMYIILSLLK